MSESLQHLVDTAVTFVSTWGLRFDLTRRLKEGLEPEGCSIPYPQRDVHLVPAADSA